ncbi:MAG: hypothetical protein K2L82_11255 [Lachnospiraceae bacterium]|nr:hypothetical protein [Lachnospiraceae bacterium]
MRKLIEKAFCNGIAVGICLYQRAVVAGKSCVSDDMAFLLYIVREINKNHKNIQDIVDSTENVCYGIRNKKDKKYPLITIGY